MQAYRRPRASGLPGLLTREDVFALDFLGEDFLADDVRPEERLLDDFADDFFDDAFLAAPLRPAADFALVFFALDLADPRPLVLEDAFLPAVLLDAFFAEDFLEADLADAFFDDFADVLPPEDFEAALRPPL